MWYDKQDLIDMLTYPRDYNSPMELEFIRNYIDNIKGMKADGFGNRFIDIGNSDVAFLSHTDTVHSQIDSTKKQEVMEADGFAFKGDTLLGLEKGKKKKKKIDFYSFNQPPLGGDDTAGVWLMLNLISEGQPGLYIFFRSEERGSQGSRYVASSSPELLKGINMAVALDRRGYYDVITTQGGKRTCSEEFAKALAKQLGGGYIPSPHGIHCDSANLTYLVPECTNLSVGYFNEHTAKEILDLKFVENLFHKLRRVRWNLLPIAKEKEKKAIVQKTLYSPEFDKTPYSWQGYNPQQGNWQKDKDKNFYDPWGFGY